MVTPGDSSKLLDCVVFCKKGKLWLISAFGIFESTSPAFCPPSLTPPPTHPHNRAFFYFLVRPTHPGSGWFTRTPSIGRCRPDAHAGLEWKLPPTRPFMRRPTTIHPPPLPPVFCHTPPPTHPTHQPTHPPTYYPWGGHSRGQKGGGEGYPGAWVGR